MRHREPEPRLAPHHYCTHARIGQRKNRPFCRWTGERLHKLLPCPQDCRGFEPRQAGVSC